ncbi:hypothetical protein JOM56_011340 [Amanita muscaria]
MIGSSPALNLSEIGKTNYDYHSEEEKHLIRDTIRCTNEALQCLALREKALKSDLERYHIALAPIKQLPCNILYCIFELHCQDELPVHLPFQRPNPPQITLSHVCSAWRRAMLNFPKLWSDIVIAPYYNAHYDKVVEIANAWLSRAKDLPCSVKFVQYWSERDSQQAWRQAIKNLVSRHSGKIERLDVPFVDHYFRDLLQLPDEKLSCIKDLCLQLPQRITFDKDDNSKFDFHKLVNLTSFSIQSSTFFLVPTPHDAYILKFSDIMWHQLRHIQLCVEVPAHFCLTIMEYSSATLETCSLVVSNDRSSVPPFSHREPIHCSRLRDFTVNVFSLDTVKVLDSFLLSLRLPNLKSLTFGACGYPGRPIPLDPRTLIMMQNISSMRLEELVISNTAFDIDVQVLLTRFPSLRRLELPTKVEFTVATMCELGAGSIGANLEDLKIKDTKLDIVALLQMVKMRAPTNRKEDNMRRAKPAPFKSVVLYYSDRTVNIEIGQLKEEIGRLGVYLEVQFQSGARRPRTYPMDIYY